MNITYNIVFSARRTMVIAINRDKTVTVRAPYFTSKKSISRLVAGKEDWILKHLNGKSHKTGITKKGNYVIGETVLYKGDRYVTTYQESPKAYVRISGENLEVGSKSADPRKITILINKWYKQQALLLFTSKMEELIKKHSSYNFRPTGLSVRSMKSRWGSCSRYGKITLNLELIKLEEKYTEYVILHELCHLIEMNHGKGYYHNLVKVCPDYLTLRSALKQFSLS